MPQLKGDGLFSFKRSARLGSDRSDQRGFSLIEIMIVLAIIGGMLVIFGSRLQNKRTAMESTIREIATATREIHNHARLFNSTYRLVIEMNGENGGGSYWIESAPGNAALMTAQQAKDLQSLSEEDQKKIQEKSGFAEDTRIIKSKQNLPKGLSFGRVEYGNRPEGINEGVAYIHFFPQGLTEEAAIHLTDGKTLNWTLVLNPITGVCDIFEGNKTLKELRAE